MDLLPLRVAAGGGSIDGQPAAALVAAGFTLLQRSAVLVRALAGRRAAILLPTSPQFLVALAACDGRGAVLINPLASAVEIGEQLQDAGVGAVLTSTALATRLPQRTVHVLLDDAPVSATVVAADGGAVRVDLGTHFGLDLEGDADAVGRNEECAIVYTSAMSGRALGAILTHRNLITNARQTAQAGAFTPDDRVLAMLPFAHLFGLTASCMGPLLAGASVRTMARFQPLGAIERIVKERITAVVGVPAQFASMLQAVDRLGGLADHALRLCICGGAPLSEALQARWADATGVELRQGYGLTEASPVALFNRLPDANRRGLLGRPFPGVSVSIRDPRDGHELTLGTEGEICIAGDTVFRGYVGETAGAASLGLAVRDGWLHTGDLGVAHADGAITFRGVLKAMFTRNGFNVYPREIERVLGELPGVRAVRAYGVTDAASEHEVAVDVDVAPSTVLTESEVRAWCEQRLAVYKRPTRIRLLPST